MILEDIFYFLVKSAVLCLVLLCVVAALLYVYQNNILYMPGIKLIGLSETVEKKEKGQGIYVDI